MVVPYKRVAEVRICLLQYYSHRNVINAKNINGYSIITNASYMDKFYTKLTINLFTFKKLNMLQVR
ncbi:hypothetical protein SMQE08_24990 [Serratia marcescens]|nr:hypothetical protein SMQE08_24990 [Serratia marcescens]BEO57381.1 hypothetical protein SMQE22_25270 [Serratia marcescens]